MTVRQIYINIAAALAAFWAFVGYIIFS